MPEGMGLYRPDAELSDTEQTRKQIDQDERAAMSEMVQADGGISAMSPEDRQATEELLREVQQRGEESGIIVSQADVSDSMVEHSTSWQNQEK